MFSKNIDGVSCRPEIMDPFDEAGTEIQVMLLILLFLGPQFEEALFFML